MTDHDAVLKKVRDLLRLAERSQSPHEAAVAAARASELLERHRLTLAELGPDATPFVTERQPLARARTLAEEALLSEICKLHRCGCYQSVAPMEPHELLVGRPHDVAAVTVLFGYVWSEIERLTASRGATGTFARDYQLGAVRGVTEQLQAAQRAARKDASAVAIERVSSTEELNEHLRNLGFAVDLQKPVRRTVDHTQFMAGVHDGAQISLHTKLPQKDPP